MRYITFFSFLFLFSCKINDFNFDNSQIFLLRNQIALDSISNNFLKQKPVANIIRRSTSKLFNIPSNSIEYYITCFNGENFNITITKNDEMNVWNENFQNIVDDNNLNKNLYNFCSTNEIDLISIRNILNIMVNLNLWMLYKSSENNFIMYYIEPFDGLIFRNDNKYMNIATNIQVEKINDSWYYFKEPY
ncbi:MAG: hypothetical protein KDK36_06485 [Leptospiraceae bacterium]|nr:hypothetical protein [Leptospiraceae bacterium]